MMMSATEEPILSRLDRLDNILKQLELITSASNRSSRNSYASSGTQTSESTADFSPKSIEKHKRPIGDVMVETEVKGTLIERLIHVEERVLKLCLELEQGLEVDVKRRELEVVASPEKKNKKKKKGGGLKKFVESCVKGSKS